MADASNIQSVMVTGATGFVGRSIVRELLARGLTPVCVVRSPEKLRSQHPAEAAGRIMAVPGDLFDRDALRRAADISQAIIHLVGIIIARPMRGQTFERIHVRGTERVLQAAQASKVGRYVHMSALGTRPDGVSRYHQTKWSAEELVRGSGLNWTIFRPSIIHGPDGEFMQLMKRFFCGVMPPAVPYFGSGQSRVQPVSVKDVAHCFVQSLFEPESRGKIYSLGGQRAYTWIEFYQTCKALLPCAKKWKPLISQPVPIAKAIATLSAPVLGLAEAFVPKIGLFRFDRGQVQMSQEDSVCDPSPAENAFHLRMRNFEEELADYAEQIAPRAFESNPSCVY